GVSAAGAGGPAGGRGGPALRDEAERRLRRPLARPQAPARGAGRAGGNVIRRPGDDFPVRFGSPAQSFSQIDSFSGKARATMAARQGDVPAAAELQAFCLGKLDPGREAEVESYLEEHPECWPDLQAVPDDEVVRHLRGAGELPAAPARSPLLRLAVEGVI